MATVIRTYTSLCEINGIEERQNEKTIWKSMLSHLMLFFFKHALTGLAILVGPIALLNLQSIWRWLVKQIHHISGDAATTARNVTIAQLLPSLTASQQVKADHKEKAESKNNGTTNRWFWITLIVILGPVLLNEAYKVVKFLKNASLENLADIIDDWSNGLDPRIERHLERKTHYSVAEIRALHTYFRRHSSGGALDLNGFQAVYCSLFSYRETDDFAALLFGAIDYDKTGSINFTNFIVALSAFARGTREERLERVFKLCDIDRDGRISQSEMLQVLTAIARKMGDWERCWKGGRTPFKRMKTLFAAMDTNRDGYISYDEFREGSESYPVILNIFDESDDLDEHEE